MKKFCTTHIGQKIPSLTKFESHYSHISQKAPQTDYKSVFFWQSWGNCNIEAHSWRGVFNGPGKVGSVTERQHLLRKGKSGCRSCRSESQAQANQLFPLSDIHISVPVGCGNPVHSCTCLERQKNMCWRIFATMLQSKQEYS